MGMMLVIFSFFLKTKVNIRTLRDSTMSDNKRFYIQPSDSLSAIRRSSQVNGKRNGTIAVIPEVTA